ncbi:MAG: UDP-N-acetylmuramoyl-L-alanyl-D-glutamate--2,6-diaminopimelate ligase [Bacteroidales bacterium]|jgi:UDP-N-acetylmuramoyl-L-alanyl-D-glutamate--2,6-diaminopimelate ligase|nr:UDP-N-acetylmuramoyl-L-alanyl-D-glutamate--2,6-diaminopimelate ligase [Bacteroidales bacterium]
MKKLKDILKHVKYETSIGNIERQVSIICFDSRKVEKDCIFVAQHGTIIDGHKFIEQSIKNGASVIVCETLPDELNNEVTYIKVKSSDTALGFMAANYFGNPSTKLKLIGVTGTNGKTTIVTLLYNLFIWAGYNAGLLSTIVNKINDKTVTATHTTPDALELNYLLAQMVDEGCEYVFMEVSSHSIVQQRIAGLKFFGAVFTNITHDHLDYHHTFDNYIKAKKLFFDNLSKTAFALVNTDDKHSSVMIQNTKAQTYTYAITHIADFHVTIMENSFEGLILNFNGVDVSTRLIGKFNASNLLAIYSVSILCGLEKEKSLLGISLLQSAEGRFNLVPLKTGAMAIVDYAHTPDALHNVLFTINEIVHGKSNIICVVGCGGNRDKTKRPEMAAIAQKESNYLIITSDNPRNEDAQKIINDMITGLKTYDNVLTIVDRKSAIKTACMLAKKGDIVLVAGKGHEKYQEIDGIKYHFDDKEELLNFNL